MGAAAAEPMKQTPMYELYARIAPRSADWPVLLAKLRAPTPAARSGKKREEET